MFKHECLGSCVCYMQQHRKALKLYAASPAQTQSIIETNVCSKCVDHPGNARSPRPHLSVLGERGRNEPPGDRRQPSSRLPASGGRQGQAQLHCSCDGQESDSASACLCRATCTVIRCTVHCSGRDSQLHMTEEHILCDMNTADWIHVHTVRIAHGTKFVVCHGCCPHFLWMRPR